MRSRLCSRTAPLDSLPGSGKAREGRGGRLSGLARGSSRQAAHESTRRGRKSVSHELTRRAYLTVITPPTHKCR